MSFLKFLDCEKKIVHFNNETCTLVLKRTERDIKRIPVFICCTAVRKVFQLMYHLILKVKLIP